MELTVENLDNLKNGLMILGSVIGILGICAALALKGYDPMGDEK
jgi:hypothetical protein